MSKIPDLRPPTKTDIPELTDTEVKFLKPIIDQLQILTKAMQRKLGEENLNQELRDLKLTNGKQVSITPQSITGKPRACDVLFTDPPYFTQELVEIISEKEIRLTVFFSTDPLGDPDTVPAGEVLTRVRITGP